jgi:hypothetical protein
MPQRPSNAPTVFAKKVFDHIVSKYDPEAAESVIVADSAFDDKPAKNPHAQAMASSEARKAVVLEPLISRLASGSRSPRKRLLRHGVRQRRKVEV